MTKLLNLFVFVAFVGLTLTACTPYGAVLRAARPQVISTDPPVLEANGDLVPFVVKARVPAKILKWEQKLTYKLEIAYRYDEGRAQTAGLDKPQTEYVGGMSFVFGDYAPDSADRRWLVARKAFALPFADRKNPGHVVARGFVTLNGKDGRRFRREVPKYTVVSPGIITTNRLVISRPRLDFTPETYVPERDSGQAELPIYSPAGDLNFDFGFGTNAAQVAEFILENRKITAITVTGYDSPEPAERKRKMAELRTKAVRMWLTDLLDKYGYINSTTSIRFRYEARPHDWTTFLDRVEDSALPDDQIQRIYRIVQARWPYERKADSLAALPCADYLQDYIYPMMRQAVVTLRYTPRPQRPDYELYLLARKVGNGQEAADALTEDELRYAASLTPLLEDKRRIYEGALKTGLSWPACHNLGLIYLLMAEKEQAARVRTVLLKKAVKNLTYAAHRNPAGAEGWYHLATAQQRLGNVLEGLHAYEYAAKGTGKTNLMRQILADKAALELTAGQPEVALTSMKYAEVTYQTVMNTGLAALLQADYATAARQYELASTLPDQPDNGFLATYCRAVTAARAYDEPALGQWLTRAVALDPSAIDRAARDLEFRFYQNSSVFQHTLRR